MNGMADDIDRAQERERIDREAAIKAAVDRVMGLEPGVADECDLCGEWAGRLIGGACAPCRDRYKLP